jgi:ABC-type transport system involved in cytochrome c biogenesis permease subunit
MADAQALAAPAMLVPVYLVTPSTFPVQVLPDSVTSPVAANNDVCSMAHADMMTVSFFMVLFGCVLVAFYLRPAAVGKYQHQLRLAGAFDSFALSFCFSIPITDRLLN